MANINGRAPSVFATPVLAPAGTAALPGVAISTDSDTGVYSAGADLLGLAAAGAQVAQVDATGLSLVAGADILLGGLAAGSATSARRLIIKKTGIADNTATDVITVTVPNANHAAVIRLTMLASIGSTDAFESSRCADGSVVVARTTGANAVAAVATLTLAQIATVAAGATLTLAYGVSAISGGVGATNTFTIQVTLDDSGNVGSSQVVVLAELVNAEAVGVTMAASP